MTTDDPTINVPPGLVFKPIENFSLQSINKFLVQARIFPDMSFWAHAVILPEIVIGANKIGVPKGRDYWTPGDKVEYGDLVITFILDVNLVAYKNFKIWMNEMAGREIPKDRFSNMTILLLDNNNNPNHSFEVEHAWPCSMSNIRLVAGDSEDDTLVIDVTFKHAGFEVVTKTNPLGDL